MFLLIRIGSACRTRVLRYLHRLYPTPKDAERDLLIDERDSPRLADSTDNNTLHPDSALVPREDVNLSSSPITEDKCVDWFRQLSSLDQTNLITSLYQNHVSMYHSELRVPPNFLELSLKAMTQLQKSGRSNILFGLAKGLGIQRDDASDSVIPTGRMPMGLLEYIINFYQSSKVKILTIAYCTCTCVILFNFLNVITSRWFVLLITDYG